MSIPSQLVRSAKSAVRANYKVRLFCLTRLSLQFHVGREHITAFLVAVTATYDRSPRYFLIGTRGIILMAIWPVEYRVAFSAKFPFHNPTVSLTSFPPDGSR